MTEPEGMKINIVTLEDHPYDQTLIHPLLNHKSPVPKLTPFIPSYGHSQMLMSFHLLDA